MSSLVGLEILVNGKPRFVGKVGICPPCDIPHLEGHKILYKKERFSDVVSRELQCFSIDRDAWNYAVNELKVSGLACFCHDRKQTILISKEKMNHAFPFELPGNEGVQLRMPLKDCKVIEGTEEIRMGYTKNVLTIKPTEPTQPFTEAIEAESQTKLF